MSIQFVKQILALFLIALAVLFIIMAINEKEILYLIGTTLSGVISYLLVTKKI